VFQISDSRPSTFCTALDAPALSASRLLRRAGQTYRPRLRGRRTRTARPLRRRESLSFLSPTSKANRCFCRWVRPRVACETTVADRACVQRNPTSHSHAWAFSLRFFNPAFSSCVRRLGHVDVFRAPRGLCVDSKRHFRRLNAPARRRHRRRRRQQRRGRQGAHCERSVFGACCGQQRQLRWRQWRRRPRRRPSGRAATKTSATDFSAGVVCVRRAVRARQLRGRQHVSLP
jgi:hypothetical protein